MKKVVFLLSVAVLLSAGAQESKSDSVAKTNAPIQISAVAAKEHIGAQAVVKGKIAEVNVGERIVRLNFEQPYLKNPFTAVILALEPSRRPRACEEYDRFRRRIGLQVVVADLDSRQHPPTNLPGNVFATLGRTLATVRIGHGRKSRVAGVVVSRGPTLSLVTRKFARQSHAAVGASRNAAFHEF